PRTSPPIRARYHPGQGATKCGTTPGIVSPPSRATYDNAALNSTPSDRVALYGLCGEGGRVARHDADRRPRLPARPLNTAEMSFATFASGARRVPTGPRCATMNVPLPECRRAQPAAADSDVAQAAPRHWEV